MTSPSPDPINEAFALKMMLMNARENHPHRNAAWRAAQESRYLPGLLEQAKLCCARIGFSKGNWETLSEDEQLAITRVLLDRVKNRQVIALLNNPHANKTYIPAIDDNLNLEKLKTLDCQFATFDGAKPIFLSNFSDAMAEDAVTERFLDAIFPFNGNPDLLTPAHIYNIHEDGCLSKEELTQLDDFALRYKGIAPDNSFTSRLVAAKELRSSQGGNRSLAP